MSALVLSLFPGIGLLDMAFEEEGFCIVRGPDLLWGGDVKRFHPPAGKFDGVIGGPPCQAHSRLRHLVEANGFKTAENLIPEFDRCVAEAGPDWFLMENVPDAPLPCVPGYAVHSFLIDHRSTGGMTRRVRRFSFGVHGLAPTLLAPDLVGYDPAAPWEPAVCASDGGRRTPIEVGGSGKVKRTWTGGEIAKLSLPRKCALQGLGPTFDIPAFRRHALHAAVGNGVPITMGRAIARAVREALEPSGVGGTGA